LCTENRSSSSSSSSNSSSSSSSSSSGGGGGGVGGGIFSEKFSSLIKVLDTNRKDFYYRRVLRRVPDMEHMKYKNESNKL
jgi:hypothetical protein